MAASLFSALSNENRLKIAIALQKGEMRGADIIKKLRLPQSEVSRGLKILHEAGVVRMRKQGQSRYFSLTTEIGQQITSFIRWHQDVIDEDARKVIRQRERQAAALMDANPSPIFAVSWPEGRIVYANPETSRFFKVKPKSITGKLLWDFVPPKKEIKERLKRVAKGHVVPHLTKKVIRMDGTEVSAEVVAAPSYLFDKFVLITLVKPLE